MADDRRQRVAVAVAAVAVALLVVFPLSELIVTAAGGGAAAAIEALTTDLGLAAAATTLWTGIVVTLVTVVLGTAAAVVTERSAAPNRRWLRVALAIPLVVPGFVAALSWARAYGPGGLLQDITGFALPGVFGAVGVVSVLVVEAVPISYLIAVAALRSAGEADGERAAQISGASATDTLRTVTVPLLRPSMVGAGVLAFVGTINAFGVPVVLGLPARFVTATTRIYTDFALAADPAAFRRAVVLSVALIVVALAAVAVVDLGKVGATVRRGPAPTVASGVRWPARWPGVVLWGYVAVAVAVPLVALALTALTRAVGLAPVPANWTLANFAEALRPQAGAALVNSFVLASGAATVVAVLAGLVVVIRHHRVGRMVATLAAAPFAVPGTALALAVLLAYGPWLRDNVLIIGVAYVAKFWALGHRSLAGAADGVPVDVVRAARSSGAGPATAVRTIVLPLLAPAAATAWLVVFLFGVHELTMSSVLYGPGTRTLAVVILNRTQLGDVTVTAALAVLLTAAVLALTPLLLLTRRIGPASNPR